MLSELRPVGNRIKLNATPVDPELFSPYSFIGFSSGTDALAAALISIAKKNPEIKDPEVLVPAYTCPDIISACIFAKVKPILIDFETEHVWLDLKSLTENISSSTVAIVAINFLGIPERIEAIRQIINSNKITIIEDSAQGLAKKDCDNYWHGDIVITSFGRGKPLNLMGGGAILYKKDVLDTEIQNNLNILVSSLAKAKSSSSDNLIYRFKTYLFNLLSYSFFYYFLNKIKFLKLGETKYHAVENIKLMPKTISDQLKSNYKRFINRHSPREKYDAIFNSLKQSSYISLATKHGLTKDNNLLRYPILVKDKNKYSIIFSELERQGLGASKMYKDILPNIDGVKASMLKNTLQYPNAKEISKSIITFPMHEDVNDKQIGKIAKILLKHSC